MTWSWPDAAYAVRLNWIPNAFDLDPRSDKMHTLRVSYALESNHQMLRSVQRFCWTLDQTCLIHSVHIRFSVRTLNVSANYEEKKARTTCVCARRIKVRPRSQWAECRDRRQKRRIQWLIWSAAEKNYVGIDEDFVSGEVCEECSTRVWLRMLIVKRQKCTNGAVVMVVVEGVTWQPISTTKTRTISSRSIFLLKLIMASTRI